MAVIAPVLFVAIYGFFLCAICAGRWRELQQEFPRARFNFYITDIWAAIVAVSPLLVWADYLPAEARTVMAPMLYGGLLGGMFLGRVKARRKELRSGAVSQLQSALQVIGGGWKALPVVVLYIIFMPAGAALVYVLLYLPRKIAPQRASN